MALIYRAIWDDTGTDVAAGVAATVTDWINSRPGIDLATLTTTDGHIDDAGPYELAVTDAHHGGICATRIRFVEHRPALGQQWTTTVCVLQPDGSDTATVWVDLERLCDDPYTFIPFIAPRLVRLLIAAGHDPRVGHIRLEEKPTAILGAPLAGLIRNPTRRLPIIVFTHDDRAGTAAVIARANAAYHRVAGVAQIFMLPPDQYGEFAHRIGEELAVWGGDARLYLPCPTAAHLDPNRHRLIPAARMSRHVDSAGDSFADVLARTTPTTPPPPGYTIVRAALTAGADTRDLDALLTEADEEIAALSATVDARDWTILDLVAEIEELERALNTASAALAAAHHHTGTAPVHSGKLPAEVDSIATAISHAGALEGIVIHPDAARDIDQLDATLTARSWGNAIWRGLRALDAYANDPDRAGGFWQWCQHTNSAWAWPASPKKLSMRESETVMTTDRLRAARQLPVDPTVERSGRIEMQAHLKIATGGGPLIPRVYFYDDTAGPTGKVHVGFIGPHRYMPNTKTN